ncbi:MAG: Crp/Fnr family transcriptional regulator [Planctomycetaceae bacterium]|nr:Crp/Fnr family transcriptional regulator [Planctomycetaceae bacterium]
MSQEIWYVRNCSLFQRLDEATLRRLEQHALIRQYAKNAPIYMPTDASDGAFLLAAGRVRICSITPDGKQAILALINPGELFGELAVIHPGRREEQAEAAVNSTVVWLAGDVLRGLMEHSTDVSLGITKLIGLRRQRIERRLRNLLFRSNHDRLGHLLLELVEQYGRETDDGVLLDVKLSHQELSAIIGVTRETVTHVLGEMQKSGVVRVSRQSIVILDLKGLAAEMKTVAPFCPTPKRAVAASVDLMPLKAQGGATN